MHTLTTSRRLTVLAVCLATVLFIPACGRRGGTPATEPATDLPSASPSATADPTPSPTSTSTSTGTWRMLPKSPLTHTPRISVWTGTELLLYDPGWVADDGSLRYAEGAAYNPATGRWRSMPLSPYLPNRVEGADNAVWSGTEMLVFGPMNAAFNPVTQRWRKLSPGGGASPSAVIWTGRYALLWGGGCCGGYENTGSLYDPAADTWRSIPAAPLAEREAGGVWTGRELIVVGGTADGIALADAAAYNPVTGTWRSLPRLPAPRMYSTITWTGTEVLVVGGEREWNRPYSDALGYRPVTNLWRRLPPMEISRAHHMAVWTGNRLLVWGGHSTLLNQGTDAYAAPRHGLAYDPVTDAWRALPRAPLSARTDAFAAWTGTEWLVWGGDSVAVPHRELLDGAAYRP